MMREPKRVPAEKSGAFGAMTTSRRSPAVDEPI
jgi:hypothetical protein